MTQLRSIIATMMFVSLICLTSGDVGAGKTVTMRAMQNFISAQVPNALVFILENENVNRGQLYNKFIEMLNSCAPQSTVYIIYAKCTPNKNVRSAFVQQFAFMRNLSNVTMSFMILYGHSDDEAARRLQQRRDCEIQVDPETGKYTGRPALIPNLIRNVTRVTDLDEQEKKLFTHIDTKQTREGVLTQVLATAGIVNNLDGKTAEECVEDAVSSMRVHTVTLDDPAILELYNKQLQQVGSKR